MGRELDFHAYYFAGKAVLNGDDFVGTAIQSESFLSGKAYVYPPITAIVFTIYGFTSHWQTSYIFHIILTLSTLFLLARCTMALIERHSIKLDIIDRVLIVGFHLFSVPAMLAIYRGNVDPFILLAIVSGFFALEQGRQASAGAIWLFAAIFKLFPAVLGIWFLFQRSWRAIIVAVGVGFSSLGIGVAIFGIQPHLEFFEYLLTERSRNAAFSNGLDPNRQWITIRRPLSHLFPLPGHMLTVIGTLIFLPALLYLYRRIESDLDSLFAVFATLAIALITIVPSTTGYVVYLLFPTVALVYVINEFIPWLLFLGGIVLINLPIYPKHIDRGIAIMGSTGPMVDGFQLVVSTMLGFMSVGLWGFLFVIAGYLLSVSSFENSNHTGPPKFVQFESVFRSIDRTKKSLQLPLDTLNIPQYKPLISELNEKARSHPGLCRILLLRWVLPSRLVGSIIHTESKKLLIELFCSLKGPKKLPQYSGTDCNSHGAS